ncbi:hypothetical protein ASF33_06695 [Methylobacterium sp. Leaf92]|nr:hypothetical protein ASF33_06695 [Methylobacterium sp. Leaf92]
MVLKGVFRNTKLLQDILFDEGIDFPVFDSCLILSDVDRTVTSLAFSLTLLPIIGQVVGIAVVF